MLLPPPVPVPPSHQSPAPSSAPPDQDHPCPPLMPITIAQEHPVPITGPSDHRHHQHPPAPASPMSAHPHLPVPALATTSSPTTCTSSTLQCPKYPWQQQHHNYHSSHQHSVV